MSQRINVRLADSRRGSQAFIAIVAVLVLVGIGIGGYWWWSTKDSGDKGPAGKPKTTVDIVKDTLDDFQMSLNNIIKEPAKSQEEVENIQRIANDEIDGLSKQVANASATDKASIVATIAAKITELKPLIDKAYAASPDLKAKLEPLVNKIMTALAAMK